MATNLLYKKKRLGSYPYLLVLFSLIFSLTIIGCWGSILLIGNELQNTIKENITVQIYLQKELSEDSIASIQRAVESKKYTLRKSNETQLEYISKDESSKKFIKETGENFAEFLGENPLRDAFIVKIAPAFSSPAQLKKVKADLSAIAGIYEVIYTENMAEAIHQNIRKLTIVAIGFTLFILVVIFLLINNTIKLAMYSQRFLIRSMQLVGAKNWFIQRPYIFRSFTLGIIGGAVSSIVILVLLEYSKGYLPEMENLAFIEHEFLFLSILTLSGGLICLISSFFAVSRYLGRSLEYLY